MSTDPPESEVPLTARMWSRRSYLVATIGIPALSGCGSAPENGGSTDTEPGELTDESDEELPEGVSRDVFEGGPVPDVYLSATSLGRETRGSETLVDKEAAGFTEYDVAVEQESHQPGTCCANCADYVIDRNGDTFGACVAVEGYIDGADWCTLWEELPEPAVPDELSEEDLATAMVPEEYRTASSQVGEERNPDDLFTQEEVSLTESVDALAEGTAAPGQSCGNCAEFIPDKNGDGWGACAKVEGYIAVEDWCSVWEHVSEEIES